MQKVFILFLFLFPCVSLTEEKAVSAETSQQIKQAETALKKILKQYQKASFQLKIKQEVYLSIIKTNLISEGLLNIKGQKFVLDLKGNPSSLTLFDGSFLWYQADKKEKVVFKLKDPMQFQILTNFFTIESFFENFQIKSFQRKNQFTFYHLEPKQEMKDLKEIFMKAGGFILEVRLTWKELNNWQKYTFSKPFQKNLSEKVFQFPSTGFQVMDQL